VRRFTIETGMTPLLSAPRMLRWVGGLTLVAALLHGGQAVGQAEKPQILPETKVIGLQPGQAPPPRDGSTVPPRSIETRPLAELPGRSAPVLNNLGTQYSASQGVISQADLRDKPFLRTTDFEERIPGLIVTTETGGIDANTHYIRGFLVDHGTDFAFFVEGVPINQDNNVHAQGYTDLQWVIPELISSMDYGKGPYYAQVGNHSTVGWTNIHFYDELPYGIFKIEAGTHDWFRTVIANSGHVGPGVLLYGVQFNYFNNAFSIPEHLNKTSAVFKYTIAPDECDKFTFGLFIHNGQAIHEPVVPLHLVESGAINRFENLVGPSEQVFINRFTLNGHWQHNWGDGALTQGNVYTSASWLKFFDDASGFLNGPQGDQVQQIDQRWLIGANLSHTWKSFLLGDRLQNTLGLQVKRDEIPRADVFATEDGVRLDVPPDPAVDREASVRQTDIGLYWQNEAKWAEKVRTILGLRGDWFDADVTDHLTPENSGTKSTAMFLPKGSLVLGPWDKTELFVNGGYSFHSNFAQGAVASIDPATGEPVARVPLLVQARGAEVGFRSQAIHDLTTTAALWQMHLGSELIFDPVAATTVPLRSSDRWGIEWTNTYRLCSWLTLDADYSWSHGRLLGIDPNTPGQHIPDAITSIFSGGPSLRLPNGLFANLRYRYWGPRYLIEDGSATSRATNVFELTSGYECQRYTLALSILNLFNSNGHDIDFFSASFYPMFGDTVNPTNDITFKPLQPFQVRASFTMRW
jgi:hypothetical protein